MAYPGSLWGTWYKGRDPDPPVEAVVLLEGCVRWAPRVEKTGRPDCEVCGGAIDPRHEGFVCLACLRADAGTERTLGFARQDTDPATADRRAADRAEHVAGLVRTADALARKWKREDRERWASRNIA